MSYIVTVEHNGERWPLRGTVWAYSMDRAQHFATEDEARFALEKAASIYRNGERWPLKASIYRKARIEAVEAK
jgi:hypothetical protein